MTKGDLVRHLPAAGLVAVSLALGACGGDSGSTPTPTPTPAPTPPPPVVVLDGNWALDTCGTDCGFVYWDFFEIPSTGTIDVTVSYTHDDSALGIWVANGNCDFDQFVADQCTFAAMGFVGNPRTVSATNQAAGAYTFIVVNGPQAEQIAFQVVFTANPTATAARASRRLAKESGFDGMRLQPGSAAP